MWVALGGRAPWPRPFGAQGGGGLRCAQRHNSVALARPRGGCRGGKEAETHKHADDGDGKVGSQRRVWPAVGALVVRRVAHECAIDADQKGDGRPVAESLRPSGGLHGAPFPPPPSIYGSPHASMDTPTPQHVWKPPSIHGDPPGRPPRETPQGDPSRQTESLRRLEKRTRRFAITADHRGRLKSATDYEHPPDSAWLDALLGGTDGVVISPQSQGPGPWPNRTQ